jgi:metallo-beta-lactamase family protein
MCEMGRILHHLKNNIGDERNIVAIVGWQAPHTLGRRLVERQRKVRIFGEEYVRHAEVEAINGLSAHADRDELLGWYDQAHHPGLEHVFVVHGELEASQALAQAIAGRGVSQVTVPEQGQTAEL